MTRRTLFSLLTSAAPVIAGSSYVLDDDQPAYRFPVFKSGHCPLHDAPGVLVAAALVRYNANLVSMMHCPQCGLLFTAPEKPELPKRAPVRTSE